MTTHRWHHPAPGTRDDVGDLAIADHTVPYAKGTHAICNGCRKPIVFVEGYEMRRDYWRVTTVSPEPTIDGPYLGRVAGEHGALYTSESPHENHERATTDCPDCEREMIAQQRAYLGTPA